MKPLSFHFKIHEALWDAFERKKNSSIKIMGTEYPIEYLDNERALAARTVIKGTTFETQNMRKASPNTDRVRNTPGYRLTWGFVRKGPKLRWLTKVVTTEDGPQKKFLRFDLTKQPNQIVDSARVPMGQEGVITQR